MVTKSSLMDAVGLYVDKIERVSIAVILALMTIVTFTNVVLRYVFNDSLIWGLEVTLVLFAWLVLLGISHCMKLFAHIGVDFVVNSLRPGWRKLFGIFASVICIAYAFLLLKGSWDYWAPFAGLYETTGHWFPTGFDWNTRDRAWYETDQIPMLDFLRFFEPLLNEGEEYEKLPRFIPYAILPFASLLIFVRFVQGAIMILNGKAETLIVSHEVEDAISTDSQRETD